ncbi:MAG: DsrE family protein [Natronospirillum sp.]
MNKRHFTLTLTASPFSTDQHERAQRFVQAAAVQGHQVGQVFFYQDAVLAAQPNLPVAKAWQDIAATANCTLLVCVSAAERRGLPTVTAPESAWEIVGLGDWVAGLNADHALHFGG